MGLALRRLGHQEEESEQFRLVENRGSYSQTGMLHGSNTVLLHILRRKKNVQKFYTFSC